MRVFLQHVGKENLKQVEDTVLSQRTVEELIARIPASAPERSYFESNPDFKTAFPDGRFNCWACSEGAQDRFNETNVGDLVLIAPTLSGDDSGVRFIGVVKAKCPVAARDASRVLWPHAKEEGYPYIFFFDTEVGHRSWTDFLGDVGYNEKYEPRGHYRGIAPKHFSAKGGAEAYLVLLRQEGQFRPLATSPPSALASDLEDGMDAEARRRAVVTTRIIRDSKLVRELKTLHDNCCQICGEFVQLSKLSSPDRYSEGHHIQPLGRDHGGPDKRENILVLCPNHHAQCDFGAIELFSNKIRLRPGHRIEKKYIEYHNRRVYGKPLRTGP